MIPFFCLIHLTEEIRIQNEGYPRLTTRRLDSTSLFNFYKARGRGLRKMGKYPRIILTATGCCRADVNQDVAILVSIIEGRHTPLVPRFKVSFDIFKTAWNLDAGELRRYFGLASCLLIDATTQDDVLYMREILL